MNIPHFTTTLADNFMIHTVDLIKFSTGDYCIFESHMIPKAHEPFVWDVVDAVQEMMQDENVIARRYKLNNTPYVIQKAQGGGFSVIVDGKLGMALYDVFLSAAYWLEHVMVDAGAWLRFAPGRNEGLR